MRTLFSASLVLVVMVAVGCGGSDGPELHPATGVVTYQNKPLAGATVTFIPAGAGTFATATTDTEGKYDLKSGTSRGVVAGKAAVTVTLTQASAGGISSTMTPEQMQQMQMSGKLQEQLDSQNKSVIPEHYAQAATSGLNVEVKAGQNEFNFPLE